MSTITEMRSFRDDWKAKMESIKAFANGFIQSNAPDAGIANNGFQAVNYAIDALDDYLRELNAEVERLEADEPGEDMRREHGTYYCSNGLRAR